MKIVFYSPYFPKHFGGGEKYLLDCITAYSSGVEMKSFWPCQLKNFNSGANAIIRQSINNFVLMI
jgi:hypothetical protein